MDNYEKKPDLQVNQASDSSAGTITAIIVALVLVVGAFLYFGSNWNATTDNPQVTQNNTTLPAPVIEQQATPAPATPPAATEPPAAEPATPPVTPPGNAPATNP